MEDTNPKHRAIDDRGQPLSAIGGKRFFSLSDTRASPVTV